MPVPSPPSRASLVPSTPTTSAVIAIPGNTSSISRRYAKNPSANLSAFVVANSALSNSPNAAITVSMKKPPRLLGLSLKGHSAPIVDLEFLATNLSDPLHVLGSCDTDGIVYLWFIYVERDALGIDVRLRLLRKYSFFSLRKSRTAFYSRIRLSGSSEAGTMVLVPNDGSNIRVVTFHCEPTHDPGATPNVPVIAPPPKVHALPAPPPPQEDDDVPPAPEPPAAVVSREISSDQPLDFPQESFPVEHNDLEDGHETSHADEVVETVLPEKADSKRLEQQHPVQDFDIPPAPEPPGEAIEEVQMEFPAEQPKSASFPRGPFEEVVDVSLDPEPLGMDVDDEVEDIDMGTDGDEVFVDAKASFDPDEGQSGFGEEIHGDMAAVPATMADEYAQREDVGFTEPVEGAVVEETGEVLARDAADASAVDANAVDANVVVEQKGNIPGELLASAIGGATALAVVGASGLASKDDDVDGGQSESVLRGEPEGDTDVGVLVGATLVGQENEGATDAPEQVMSEGANYQTSADARAVVAEDIQYTGEDRDEEMPVISAATDLENENFRDAYGVPISGVEAGEGAAVESNPTSTSQITSLNADTAGVQSVGIEEVGSETTNLAAYSPLAAPVTTDREVESVSNVQAPDLEGDDDALIAKEQSVVAPLAEVHEEPVVASEDVVAEGEAVGDIVASDYDPVGTADVGERTTALEELATIEGSVGEIGTVGGQEAMPVIANERSPDLEEDEDAVIVEEKPVVAAVPESQEEPLLANEAATAESVAVGDSVVPDHEPVAVADVGERTAAVEELATIGGGAGESGTVEGKEAMPVVADIRFPDVEGDDDAVFTEEQPVVAPVAEVHEEPVEVSEAVIAEGDAVGDIVVSDYEPVAVADVGERATAEEVLAASGGSAGEIGTVEKQEVVPVPANVRSPDVEEDDDAVVVEDQPVVGLVSELHEEPVVPSEAVIAEGDTVGENVVSDYEPLAVGDAGERTTAEEGLATMGGGASEIGTAEGREAMPVIADIRSPDLEGDDDAVFTEEQPVVAAVAEVYDEPVVAREAVIAESDAVGDSVVADYKGMAVADLGDRNTPEEGLAVVGGSAGEISTVGGQEAMPVIADVRSPDLEGDDDAVIAEEQSPAQPVAAPVAEVHEEPVLASEDAVAEVEDGDNIVAEYEPVAVADGGVRTSAAEEFATMGGSAGQIGAVEVTEALPIIADERPPDVEVDDDTVNAVEQPVVAPVAEDHKESVVASEDVIAESDAIGDIVAAVYEPVAGSDVVTADVQPPGVEGDDDGVITEEQLVVAPVAEVHETPVVASEAVIAGSDAVGDIVISDYEPVAVADDVTADVRSPGVEGDDDALFTEEQPVVAQVAEEHEEPVATSEAVIAEGDAVGDIIVADYEPVAVADVGDGTSVVEELAAIGGSAGESGTVEGKEAMPVIADVRSPDLEGDEGAIIAEEQPVFAPIAEVREEPVLAPMTEVPEELVLAPMTEVHEEPVVASDAVIAESDAVGEIVVAGYKPVAAADMGERPDAVEGLTTVGGSTGEIDNTEGQGATPLIADIRSHDLEGYGDAAVAEEQPVVTAVAKEHEEPVAVGESVIAEGDAGSDNIVSDRKPVVVADVGDRTIPQEESVSMEASSGETGTFAGQVGVSVVGDVRSPGLEGDSDAVITEDQPPAQPVAAPLADDPLEPVVGSEVAVAEGEAGGSVVSDHEPVVDADVEERTTGEEEIVTVGESVGEIGTVEGGEAMPVAADARTVGVEGDEDAVVAEAQPIVAVVAEEHEEPAVASEAVVTEGDMVGDIAVADHEPVFGGDVGERTIAEDKVVTVGESVGEIGAMEGGEAMPVAADARTVDVEGDEDAVVAGAQPIVAAVAEEHEEPAVTSEAVVTEGDAGGGIAVADEEPVVVADVRERTRIWEELAAMGGSAVGIGAVQDLETVSVPAIVRSTDVEEDDGAVGSKGHAVVWPVAEVQEESAVPNEAVTAEGSAVGENVIVDDEPVAVADVRERLRVWEQLAAKGGSAGHISIAESKEAIAETADVRPADVEGHEDAVVAEEQAIIAAVVEDHKKTAVASEDVIAEGEAVGDSAVSEYEPVAVADVGERTRIWEELATSGGSAFEIGAVQGPEAVSVPADVRSPDVEDNGAVRTGEHPVVSPVAEVQVTAVPSETVIAEGDTVGDSIVSGPEHVEDSSEYGEGVGKDAITIASGVSAGDQSDVLGAAGVVEEVLRHEDDNVTEDVGFAAANVGANDQGDATVEEREVAGTDKVGEDDTKTGVYDSVVKGGFQAEGEDAIDDGEAAAVDGGQMEGNIFGKHGGVAAVDVQEHGDSDDYANIVDGGGIEVSDEAGNDFEAVAIMEHGTSVEEDSAVVVDFSPAGGKQ